MASTRFPLSSIFSWVCVLVWVAGHGCGLAKECTNIPTQDESHTLRAISFEKQASIRSSISSSSFRTPLASYNNDPSRRAALLEKTSPDDTKKKNSEEGHFSKVVNKSGHYSMLQREEISSIPKQRRGEKSADLLDSFVRTSAQRRMSSDHQKHSLEVDENSGTRLSCAKNATQMTLVASSSPTGIRGGLEFGQQPVLKEVSLHRVTLAPDSLHGIAQETNLKYLLMLDVDRLVWSFRVTAGLPVPGSPYGGWEHPEMELRGHFVGHYLSAAALMWASTHNGTLQEKMTTLVDALGECQDKLGTGYLSAFPSEFFDRFEAIKPVWAPYYTIHKIMAGLLDQYSLARSEKALGMLLWMAEYFLSRVEAVIHKYTIERHWNSLNEEVGGMNDVMYRLFMLTGDPEHLKLAHLFDKPCFLGLLALQTDGLSGFHSNTHIPLVVGAQMRFEATGDKLYADISRYFMGIINTSHRYATGGTSVSEFWIDPNRNGGTLGTENQETCTTYNMLKVARNMFRWTKDVSYADYYERALVNGILGIQRGAEPGVMIYMLPQGPGTSKAVSYHGWGTPYNAFWCCYGTGIESFSKLGDSIYYEDYDSSSFSLHIAQYVSSNLTWDAVGLLLSQKVLPLSSDDPYLHVTFDFYDLPQGGNGNQAALSLRIPIWTTATTTHIRLNGLYIGAPKPAGNYVTISRVWNAGDVLHLDLGVSLRLEEIQDDREYYSSLHAILYGPYLLAGMTDGGYEIGAVNTSCLSSWIIPVPALYSSKLYSFSQDWFLNTGLIKLKDSDGHGLGNESLVLSYANGLAEMKAVPLLGTNEAAQSTFRLTSALVEASDDFMIGSLVTFEVFNSPGRVLAHTGFNQKLTVVDIGTYVQSKRTYGGPASNTSFTHEQPDEAAYSLVGQFQEGYEVFKIVKGLSGKENTVSFEAASLNGCFIASGSDASITLQCQSNMKWKDPYFEVKASFTVNKGMASYNPVSFFAKGLTRQYLLFPIYAYQDESYATYFNLTET